MTNAGSSGAISSDERSVDRYSALLEAVRDRTKTVDLKQINRVLLQPHWRKEVDLPQ